MSTCGGLQKASRPIDRCQEMSQCGPSAAAVDAISTHPSAQDRETDRARERGAAAEADPSEGTAVTGAEVTRYKCSASARCSSWHVRCTRAASIAPAQKRADMA